MSTLGRWGKGFLLFWWDSVIGDDWRIAAGVVVGLLLTWTLASNGITAWWVLPVAVAALLALSLRLDR